MGENTGLGSVLPQSKKELHKQGTLTEHISEKAHTEARRPKAFFIC